MKILHLQNTQKTLKRSVYAFAASLLFFSTVLAPTVKALPPFTVEDFDSLFIGENYRDDGNMRKQPCSVGSFSDTGENGETVWRFFADKLPAVQIAGIIGNMVHESGILPQRLQGTPASKITTAQSLVDSGRVTEPRLGWGLVQWTPPSKMILSYDNPSTADSITNQLQFLWNQLQGGFPSPEKAAGDALKGTTTAAQAAEVFMRRYERPAASSIALSLHSRIAAAEAALVRYGHIATVNAPVDAPTDTTTVAFDNTCNAGDESTLVEVAKAQEAKGGGDFYRDVPNGNAADFVSWALNEIGKPILTGGLDGGWRISSVQSLFDSLSGDDRFIFIPADVDKPIPGDIAIFLGQGTENTGIVITVTPEGDKMDLITTGPNATIRYMRDASTTVNALGLVGYIRTVGGDGDANDLIPPAGPPTTKCDPATQVTVSAPASNFAQQVAGAAEGTCFFLQNGQYNFHDVRPKNNMKFVGESRSGVVVNGSGYENAFSGNASNVAISNFSLRNFDNPAGQKPQEQAPIRGTLGIWRSDPGAMATNWLVENMMITDNVASGIFVGDNFTVRNNDIHNNGVTGIGGDQFSGGVIQSNTIYSNGANAAGGVDVNGGGIKITQANGTVTRVFITDNTVFNNAIGIWCDVDCNGITINNNRVYDNTNSGIFYEVSRNGVIANNTVINSSSWVDWRGEFNNGSIAVGESAYVLIEGNTIEGGQSAVTIRQSKRPADNESFLTNIINSGVDLNTTSREVTVNNNTIKGSGSIGASHGPTGVGLMDYGSIRFTNNNYNGADQNGNINFWWNRVEQSYNAWKAAGRQ